MASTDEELEIAKWMLEQFQASPLKMLKQSRAVFLARQKFGAEHFYKNDNGNWAFNQGILDAFRDLSGDDVVWSRSSQKWRARKPQDPPGRMVR